MPVKKAAKSRAVPQALAALSAKIHPEPPKAPKAVWLPPPAGFKPYPETRLKWAGMTPEAGRGHDWVKPIHGIAFAVEKMFPGDQYLMVLTDEPTTTVPRNADRLIETPANTIVAVLIADVLGWCFDSLQPVLGEIERGSCPLIYISRLPAKNEGVVSATVLRSELPALAVEEVIQDLVAPADRPLNMDGWKFRIREDYVS